MRLARFLLIVSLFAFMPSSSRAAPAPRQAVVRIELALDRFSFGPELAAQLAAGQPWSQYEAELARRLRVGSMGTGFFVNPEGDLVTNAHVLLSGVRYRGLPFTQAQWDSLTRLLSSIRQAWVTVGEGESERSYVAVPLAIAEDLDLAVLRVSRPPGDQTSFAFLTLASSDALRVGQSITALGFPAEEFQASGGEILSLIQGSQVHEEMRLVRRASPEAGQPPVTVSGTTAGPILRLQHSAPTGHGSSGGPLLNDQGQVIGVAYALLTDRTRPGQQPDAANLNLAIASNVLKRFLREHAIAFTEASK
jgi:S1-C subfamily serine protease